MPSSKTKTTKIKSTTNTNKNTNINNTINNTINDSNNIDSNNIDNTEPRYLAQALRERTLKIRGARTHNLKNIDLDIPKHTLTVITGVSGSGKSSLAFDTLYAEGQRRYVESLSAYARQFLQLMDKPDVDSIEGLSPAISIEQKAASHNPRSTVGTVTEIHDYLRLLFARAGTPHCPKHPKNPLAAQSVSQMVDTLLAMPVNTKLMILAPVISDTKGTHQDLVKQLQAQGFIRLRLKTGDSPARLIETDQFPDLKKTEKHTIDVVVDRIKIKTIEINTADEQRQRLAESLETALRLAQGRALVVNMDNESGESHVFSNRYACPECGFSLKELEPRLFSFNNPAGACESCSGLGEVQFMDASRIVMHPNLSLENGAIKGWDKRNGYYHQVLQNVASHYHFSTETPWKDLPKEAQHIILNGTGIVKIPIIYLSDKGTSVTRNAPFEGIINNFERRYRDSESNFVKEDLARYISAKPCPDCQGTRLKAEARYVKLIPAHGTFEPSIHEVSRMTLADSLNYLTTLKLSGAKGAIAERILREVIARLTFLNNVGLNYLSLDRSANTLSGGEGQRIRLASQIGSGLTGVMYVLDEPSIGLHQRDNDRLISTLQHLRDLGNTVLVVEHDEDMIRAADCVVDMGPGAGEHGGTVLAQGTAQEIIANVSSITGDYLAGRKSIAIPKKRHQPSDAWVSIVGASSHNLKNIKANIPVGLFTCVTGVSGSGKSTLINDTLYKASAKAIHKAHEEPAAHIRIEGLDRFDKVINVDQSAIGRTPRSNPATYTGLFTPLRELFANTAEAKARGYEPGRFSFNVKGGRCEACEGDGVVKVAMHFLPDIYVPCDTCEGKRYNRETLDVRWKGMNIAEVLNLTVEEAYRLFDAVPTVNRKLATLMEVGLSYIRLGQNATTLSGGEAQRVKLSLELSKRDTGKTLYVLDEPTTGLHFHDVAQLLKVIHQLRDSGNTIVVIEHNLDVIKTADWLIDMGPEGGAGGGHIVAEGTPETVATMAGSYTGQYLKRML
ncbi:MAG: ATPase and damage recognition protein of nucleotide excision repair excinuclease UvrABC [Pseudomonadota bacterium]|jgi:excinuclease ABC subunit A